MTKRIQTILLGIILLLALLLRLWGVSYDLPYIYHPDEPNNITVSQNIFRTGDLNPHFFHYPSLFLYINSLAYIPYYFVGKILDVFQSRSNILPPVSITLGATFAPTPSAVLLGRIVTICFGLGTIVLAYFVGKRISGKAIVGLLASLFVAVSPTSVFINRMVTPDSFVAFFSMASLFTALLVYQQGKTWQYVVAGLCVGLTFSTKYNAFPIFVPLLVAHFLRHGRKGFQQPMIYFALLISAITFFVTSPYTILDSTQFLADFKYEAHHYSTGHPGMEGNSLAFYSKTLTRSGGLVLLVAIVGICYCLISYPKEALLLLSFPLVYFPFISSFVVRNERTLLPLTPFLAVFAAWFLILLSDRLAKLETKSFRNASSGLLFGFIIVVLVPSISKTIEDTKRLTRVDSRAISRVWIDQNLPAGAKIAVEAYSPFINTSQFSVKGYFSMIDHPAKWYVEQGFDYLVFSQGMFKRYFQDPERYKDQTLRYENLFRQFDVVKIFKDGNYEIRIYKVQ